MKFVRRFKRGEKGQALVEFALVIPIVLLLFLGIIDFSRVSTADTQITNATQEAAKEFSQLANTPEYEKWYNEDINLPHNERRINIELKNRVVANVNTVPDENIYVDSQRIGGRDGDVVVRVTADVPSLSQITFREKRIQRQVTLKVPATK